MSERLPDGAHDGDAERSGGENTFAVTIDALHLHANDIDALRRLSEADPELARALVKQREDSDRRDHASFRLGILAGCVLVLGTLFACSYVLIKLGVLLSLLLVFVMIAVAFLVRVVLSGEWPETTWVGHMVKAIIATLGGAPKGKGDD